MSLRDTINSWRSITEAGRKAFELAHSTHDTTYVNPIDKDEWNVDGLYGADGYEVVFKDLMFKELKEKIFGFSFEQWVNERKLAGKSTHIIDLFGGAYFLDDFTNIDSILGVRLKNLDKKIEHDYILKGNETALKRLRSIITSLKRSIIEANLLDNMSWNKINSHLLERGTKKADLIIVRPIAGVKKQIDRYDLSEEKAQFMFQFLKRMYNLLSHDDGILLIHFTDSAYDVYRDRLRQVKGLNIEIDGRVIKIKKTKDSPIRLSFGSVR